MTLKSLLIKGIIMLLYRVLPAVLAFALHANAQANSEATSVTNSEKYSWLENDSPERINFIHVQSAKLNVALKVSKNTRRIEKLLRNAYGNELVIESHPLKSGKILKLIDRGLSQPTELVLVDGLKTEVLASNFSLKKNESYRFLDMNVSPDESKVAIRIAHKGSIDLMGLALYDLSTRQFKLTSWTFESSDWAWASPTELVLCTATQNGDRRLVTHNLATGEISHTENGSILNVAGGWALYELIVDDLARIWLQRSSDGLKFEIDSTAGIREVLGADDRFVYFYASGAHHRGEIRKISLQGDLPADEKPSGDVVVPEGDLQIRNATFNDGHFFLQARMGADRRLQVYNVNSELITEVTVPDCCSIQDATWNDRDKSISVTLMSAINSGKAFTWNIESSSWATSPEPTMMIRQGIQYKTEVVFSTSDDKTQIPIRLTYRKDLLKNGLAPTLIESYGGFEVAGYFDPSFSVMNRAFLKRGGIYVGPALRGGDEFDRAWHQQAAKEKKITTYRDLISVARFLVTDGWTTPSKIISTGGSNGGLTVSASALLAPDAFGLVIPRGGVNDLLAKDRLNPENYGWSNEYGNASDLAAIPYLKAISPVELAKNQGGVKFLILDGINDTRVHFAHSLKLAAALEDLGGSPQNVYLSSVKNSGHWQTKFPTQNIIAWRVNTIMWTMIFDTAKMSAATSPEQP